mmetsp:Transcript_21571/g.53486  ORF Transcript_21571/g.53486 Transcript_21571/m.53486 type:complete len:88 (-) Transcript_21571:13-276(-)
MAMTEQEFSDKIKAAFDAADTNKNGALEESEARVLAQRMAEANAGEFTEAKFQERFAAMDKNADGKVTWEEFSSKAIAAAKEKGVVA